MSVQKVGHPHRWASMNTHTNSANNNTENYKCVKLNNMHSAGKYVEGQTCDPKTWKANFRCAMNSLPDIEEVKDKSVNKGHQAMRVFRMLPTTPKSRGEKTDRKWASIFFIWTNIGVQHLPAADLFFYFFYFTQSVCSAVTLWAV